VLDGADGHMAGWLTQRDVLLAYHERLQRSVSEAQQRASGAASPPAPQPGRTTLDLRGYRVVDLELRSADPPAGRRVAEVSWPSNSLLLAVRHGDEVTVPTGATQLRRGDRLTVLVPADRADTVVETLLRGSQTAAE